MPTSLMVTARHRTPQHVTFEFSDGQVITARPAREGPQSQSVPCEFGTVYTEHLSAEQLRAIDTLNQDLLQA